MKGQETSTHRRLLEDVKIPAEGVDVSNRHSINANVDDNADHAGSDYVQLGNPSKKIKSRATPVLATLTTLGISVEAFNRQES